jgi:hypothetical protein
MAASDFALDGERVAGVRAQVEAYERERAAVLARRRWQVPLYVLIVVALVIVLAVSFNTFADPREQWLSSPHVFLYLAGIIAACLAYVAATRPAWQLGREHRQRLMSIVFGFIENLRYRYDETPESFERLPRGLVGEISRQSFDDVFAGRYEGFPFELYESELGNRGDKEATAFKGVVIAFENLAPFPGVLLAVHRTDPDAVPSGGLFRRSLEEIESGVATVDEAYDFRTDNPKAARPLVEGNLARALEWLDETWPEDRARIALSHHDGFLLLPLGKNYFELPPVSEPVDYGRHIEPILRDMATLLATASLVRKAAAA